MRAGLLRNRVIVQEPILTQNNFGEEEVSGWQRKATVWANIVRDQGNENYDAQQIKNVVDLKITTRYFAWITPKMRLIFKDKPIDIDSVVDPDGRRRSLEIRCKQVA
jgi:SPP1 family predicted phage head-tail adaptor